MWIRALAPALARPAQSRRGRRLLVVCTTLALLFPVHATALAPATQPGGVVLDGYGGLHPFGGAMINTAGAPYWPGWNIARAVAVRADGSGGWTLDGFGGIHPWGSAQPIAAPVYWPGWDIARDMVLTSRDANGMVDGRQGYVLDGFGGIHPWGGAVFLSGPYPGADVARSLLVHLGAGGAPDGGWMLSATGSLHAFGGAAGKPVPVALTGTPLWVKIRGNSAAGYLVGHWGGVQTWGAVHPFWSGYTDWGAWDIEQDVALLRADGVPSQQPQSAPAAALFAAAHNPSGGVTLDGYGGLHPFGDAPLNTAGSPYWAGWDIARAAQVRSDGSGGWTLDGFGAIHHWGAAPAISSPVYWSGFDIARSFAVTSTTAGGVANGVSGYVLDGFGGVHPWGNALPIGGPPYMGGFDIYRGLVIHSNAQGTPDGGWVMDDVGRTYAFGAAPAVADATPAAGRPLYRAMHQTSFGWYSVVRDGDVISFGGGFVHPSWTGWTDWGPWGIVRDVSLVNAVDPLLPAQPLSAAAAQDYVAQTNGLFMLNAPLTKQAHPLDCEAATLQMVLASRGTNVSQDWELAYWGADLRPAVRDSAGNIVQWGDPYTGFVGNVNGSEWNATGYGIYYPPLVRISQNLGHQVIGKEGWSIQQLFDLVVAGYPAAVEGSFNLLPATPRRYTAWDGRSVQYVLNNHVFALVGVNFGAQTVLINDPWSGTRKQFSWADFARSFSYINNMATVVS